MFKFARENAIFFISIIIMVGIFFGVSEARKIASQSVSSINEAPVIDNTNGVEAPAVTPTPTTDTIPTPALDTTPAKVEQTPNLPTPKPAVKTVPKFVPRSNDEEEGFDD